MNNVFLTSLTTPEVRQLFREELETYFKDHISNFTTSPVNEQPINGYSAEIDQRFIGKG